MNQRSIQYNNKLFPSHLYPTPLTRNWNSLSSILLHKVPDCCQFFLVRAHGYGTTQPRSESPLPRNLELEPLWPEFSHRVNIKIKNGYVENTWNSAWNILNAIQVFTEYINFLFTSYLTWLFTAFKRRTQMTSQVEGRARIRNKDRRSAQSLLSFAKNTPLITAIFLSGRVNYRSIPNLLVFTPTFHTAPFKYHIYV